MIVAILDSGIGTRLAQQTAERKSLTEVGEPTILLHSAIRVANECANPSKGQGKQWR